METMISVKKTLNKISGGKVLDIGTGVGDFIKILKKELKDYSELIGIDSTDKSLEMARKEFKEENIKFIKMDAEKLTFEDNSIDTVCISNTLHHLPDIDKIFAEMKRVLKPGGTFIINEMFCDNQNEKQLTHVYIHHFGAEIDTLLGRWYHNKTFKKQQIIDIVNNADITIIDSIEYTYDDGQCLSEESKEYFDSISQAIDTRVESVKEFSTYEEYKTRAEKIKKRLYTIGLQGAVELMIIGKHF